MMIEQPNAIIGRAMINAALGAAPVRDRAHRARPGSTAGRGSITRPMQATVRQRPSDTVSVGLLIAITLAGLLLRLPSFGNSLFGDEVGTYYIVTGHSLGRILHLQYGHSVDLTPPLYFALAWLAERFGSSPQLLRLVPLLAGLVSIPLTYAVGARTVGRRAAIVGASLVALSPFLIFYSTEARAYAPVMALTLGSTLALLKALEQRRAIWLIEYAVLSCAAV